MYGPSPETSLFDQTATIPPTNINEQVSLEQVELEILLSMKIADGQDFEKALQTTMVCSGNEYLFSFPCDRFPIPCTDVACVKLAQKNELDSKCIYLYQQAPGTTIQIADTSQLDGEFEQFAHSFIAVMEQLRGLN